ncbi:MAG TPA: DUF2786 domain-containing protein [Conexivisphaerales archaeon]|nr:DUF2786 domain-containing protein [Conexivisphaerales archaeon]
MTPRRVIERLSKLLALSSSSNHHEAAAARAAAERLRCQYALSEDDARKEVEGVAEHEEVLSGPEWGPAWKFVVVAAASEACGAVAVSGSMGRGREVRVSGEGDSVRRALDLAGQMIAAVGAVEGRMVREVGEAVRDPEVAAELGECGSRRAARSFRVGAAYALAKLVLVGRAATAARGEAAPSPLDGVLAVVGCDGARERARETARAKYAPEVRSDFATRDTSEVWMEYGYRLTASMVSYCEGEVVVQEVAVRETRPPDEGT